ncbi:MAG: hypothetical protein J1E62_08265 [Lachnospiraceae bacterium]|nr:hypothetical protein [Lachnospiraceae bacterium]
MGKSRLFQYAVDHSLEMMFLFSEDGKIIYGNQTAMDLLEYGDELYDCRVEDLFPGIFERQDDGLKFDFQLGVTVSNVMAYRRNRTCFATDVRIMKYVEENSYICMAVDSSRQNFLAKRADQADQEVEEAQKVKTQFVANVTHELRTPVNGILGNTKELLEREQDPDKMKILRLMERGCADMHAIINNILDFSKLEAGKFTLESREFNFRSMIDYVRANHINKITEKGLELFVTVSPEVPETVIGDELRIVQILNNLLSNACKFTSVGKIVVEAIKTAQIGNRIELFFLVIDSGIGIDKAGQDKLFKSFSQVEASTTRKYGGTGLGLNICKQLVELMDGDIHVESEKGKGTTFTFHIWVEVANGEENTNISTIDVEAEMQRLSGLAQMGEKEQIYCYGTAENTEEINKKMSKLILCVDMENWEKAEMFADTLKQLTEEAPAEIKSGAFRLKMAVQRGDYEKTTAAYEKLQTLLEQSEEGANE